MIRFWICPKKRKMRFFGFGHHGFGFSQENAPSVISRKCTPREGYF